MIYLSGNSKGFTLLEVLVTLVLFSTVFTLLIELESNHIKRVYKNIEKLKALEYWQEYKAGLNPMETNFKMEKRSFTYDNFIVNEEVILNKNNEEVLTIHSYKLKNEK